MLTLALAITSSVITAAPCSAVIGDITLIGSLPIPNYNWISDVWGYTDEQSGKHYALVGEINLDQLYIIEVTDPTNPVLVNTVFNFPSFDAKTFGNYVYGCTGGGSGNTSRILDITDILNPIIQPGSFVAAHNIAIDHNGILYTEIPGFSVFDLNTSPTAPESLWTSGLGDGHDATPKGNRLYDFGGWAGTRIWDITNPGAPILLSTIVDTTVNYSHHGDATADDNYLYVCDELAMTPEADIIIYDISTPGSPVRVGEIESPAAIVHNLYIVGDFAFVSHYTEGFKVFDVSNPLSTVLLDEYDTSSIPGPKYAGGFGVYPWGPGGLVYLSDMENGLFIFSIEGYAGTATSVDRPSLSQLTLHQNQPNPFNPSTSISFELAASGNVRLEIFDVRGKIVRKLFAEGKTAGPHTVHWDGRNDSNIPVSSGVYYYQLSSALENITMKMVLLK